MNIFFRDISKDEHEHYFVESSGTHIFFLKNRNGRILFDILKNNARVYIFGIYNGNKNQKFNIETIQRHSGKKSFSKLYIKSVLDRKSSFHFSGIIRIEKNASGSEGSLENRNLICGKNSFADSRPQLEIKTNETLCSHSSTTSPIAHSDIFYMQTRGIQKSRAKQMLKNGFLQEILYQAQSISRSVIKNVSFD